VNVLYVSSESSMGGASQSLIDMIVGLRDYITPIVIIPGRGELEKELQKQHIRFLIIPMSRGYGKIGEHNKKDEDKDFRINYEAAVSMQSIIRDENINLIHVNSSVCNAGAIAAILAGITYVWHLREMPEKQFRCEFWDKDLKEVLFKNAYEKIAISNCVAQDYAERYGGEYSVIYDAVDDRRYSQCIDTKKPKEKSFILVGNISESKGQLDAIKAVKKIKDLGVEDINLHIVGGYSSKFLWCFKRYTKKYGLDENIFLYPFMEDLTELRKISSFALVTSRFEALGRVTVEAMLSGCIVIGADTAGTLEIVGTSGDRGILYEQGDVDSLATAMIKAIELPTEKKQMIRYNAQKYALEKFNKENYAQSIVGIYRGLDNRQTYYDKNVKDYILKRYTMCVDSDGMCVVNNPILKKQKINDISRLWDNLNYKISDLLMKNGIKKIIIYGMGQLGTRLYDECETCNIEIIGVMDKDGYFLKDLVNVIEGEIPVADAIIVTAIFDYENVKNVLLKKTQAKILDIMSIFEGIE
jgi:hypothetical protein